MKPTSTPSCWSGRSGTRSIEEAEFERSVDGLDPETTEVA
jgi:hypothetical protein